MSFAMHAPLWVLVADQGLRNQESFLDYASSVAYWGAEKVASLEKEQLERRNVAWMAHVLIRLLSGDTMLPGSAGPDAMFQYPNELACGAIALYRGEFAFHRSGSLRPEEHFQAEELGYLLDGGAQDPTLLQSVLDRLRDLDLETRVPVKEQFLRPASMNRAIPVNGRQYTTGRSVFMICDDRFHVKTDATGGLSLMCSLCLAGVRGTVAEVMRHCASHGHIWELSLVRSLEYDDFAGLFEVEVTERGAEFRPMEAARQQELASRLSVTTLARWQMGPDLAAFLRDRCVHRERRRATLVAAGAYDTHNNWTMWQLEGFSSGPNQMTSNPLWTEEDQYDHYHPEAPWRMMESASDWSEPSGMYDDMADTDVGNSGGTQAGTVRPAEFPDAEEAFAFGVY